MTQRAEKPKTTERINSTLAEGGYEMSCRALACTLFLQWVKFQKFAQLNKPETQD
jgi:hypothetical protein